ncbi:hypothetical protein BISA_1188 [Bifidobacterium saguini DSM 23967]|uniref:Uncharacterized protein n=3 Tax=Bifidobacterium TaxID=1678 RepID=A0A2N5IU74_9BIFI|nr:MULTISPECIES: hypothetical protein [Bifidobacterium]KFI93024.1 hypothetical protein BISA_1188 [Bifidobacterium saguini DSM 23967]PLS25488.1 hypothetical protein Tam1G_0312 [Bifidobacterium imperatoris]QSY57066.1 hypothetical protein BLI708_07310 [Bifidobacterium imperatoris]QTB91338.1 hypothetical protein BSD967_02590 [Bifidobacterium saguini]
MFGLFNEENDAVRKMSWHYSAEQNRMVPCDNTPCDKHGACDVIAANEYEATVEVNRRISLYNEHEKSKNRNPNTVLPSEYDNCSLFKGNLHSTIISFNSLYIGNARYMPTVKKFTPYNYDLTVNFAKRCEKCHGKGTIHDDKENKDIECPECRGSKYSEKCSASPADMVLIQDIKDDEDARFHDFVKKYPDEFNEYMRHVMMSSCYLANKGEKALYLIDIKRNFKQDMANNPDETLIHMRDLKSKYDEIMRYEPKGLKYNDIMAMAINSHYKKEKEPLEIMSFHNYVDKKTKEQKVVMICRNINDNNRSTYKIFTEADPNIMVGGKAFLRAAYGSGYDFTDPTGVPCLKLRNVKIAIRPYWEN